jgi:methylsterol monooxygenase
MNYFLLNCDNNCYNYLIESLYNTCLFWILSLTFLYFDITQPKWIVKYKIQNKHKLTKNRIFQMIKQNIFNQMIITPIFSFFWYNLLEIRQLSTIEPLIYDYLTHFFVYFLISEILFYHFHRLLHTQFLYKYIHRFHHDEPNPIALSGYNNNWIEHILNGLIAMYTGHLVMGSNVKIFNLWIKLVTFVSVIFHCGYHFPFMFPNEFHDYHHLKHNQCYGVFGLFDYIYGTDKEYKKSKQYKRDKFYFYNEHYPQISF